MKKVREGYKMTELGEIPEEWEVKNLGVVFEECQYGISDYLSDNGKYPVLRMNNIRNGKVNLNDLKFIDLDQNEFNKYSLREHDILFNRTNSIDLVGKAGIYDCNELAIFASYLLRIKINRNIADPKFINYYMNSNEGQGRIKAFATLGVSQVNINANNLKKVLIPLPAHKEQQKIASILSSIDEQIEITDNLIEKTKKLKKGLMQRLLTKGIGHERFKDTEIGRIPEEWKVMKIEDIAEIVSGGTPSTKMNENWENGNIYWATPTDITANGKYISKTRQRITDLGLSNSSATLLPLGSILMTSRATIGERSINTVSMCTNQGFKSFICKEKLYNEFMYYMIDIIRNDLINLAGGSTFLEISKSVVANYKIVIPPVKEQQKIASILSSVDEQINQYESKKQKLQALKKGLMQKLLTGKIRVKVS